MATILCLLLLNQLAFASERKFDVKDDIFAFPQYDVSYAPSFILEKDAADRLKDARWKGADGVEYQSQFMSSNGRSYVCNIPQIKLAINETEITPEPTSEVDLIAAADRGWQLIKEMEGGQCLYYTTGWWSYVFCYNKYVKQYHALATSSQVRAWPPPEDPNTESYILGTYETLNDRMTLDASAHVKPGELQTQSETTFLSQNLDGGTACDLTGKPRKIEVQYHCRPGIQDRIGWIKETATCTYQMVVYTSRLCDDVAFQPPKEAPLHQIQCEEIVRQEFAQSWNAQPRGKLQVDSGSQKRKQVGKIQLGARQLVGINGKNIERGKIVMTPEEQAEIVVMQVDGQIQSLSTAELKKLDLSPEEVATFQKKMKELAGDSDWKIERLGDAHGQLSLRGIVDAKKKDKKKQNVAEDVNAKDDVEGSEEHFKDEV